MNFDEIVANSSFRDYDQAVRRLSDEMVEANRKGDLEELERLKAQWAYACHMRDLHQSIKKETS